MRADTGLESPAAVQSGGVGVCQDDQHPLWAAEWYHELPRQQPATEPLEKMHDKKKLGPAAQLWLNFLIKFCLDPAWWMKIIRWRQKC